MEHIDFTLWPGGPVYTGASPGTDSLCLADFAAQVQGAKKRALDMGSGDGILALLLMAACPGLTCDALETRPEAAEKCRNNLQRNFPERPAQVLNADWRSTLLPGPYDIILSNPPYFKQGSGFVSPDDTRDRMRREDSDSSALFDAVRRRLKTGGKFCLVSRTERMAELLRLMAENRLEPKVLRLISHRPGMEPKLFLCAAAYDAAPGLKVLPTLLLSGPDGRKTEEYSKICHWEDD